MSHNILLLKSSNLYSLDNENNVHFVLSTAVELNIDWPFGILCVSCLSFSFTFFILINLIFSPDYLEYELSVSSVKWKCDAFIGILKILLFLFF